MKIHSFARIVALPFVIIMGVVLYFLFFEEKQDWYPFLIPLVVILASIYAFHPKIDYWWHQKQPPRIPDKLKKLVYTTSRFYQELEEDEKQLFLDKLGVFINHKAFYLMRKEKEALPEDIKALIGICAITVGFKSENWFFNKYDYFIAYQHPFPTPNKQFLHSVEINHEDGVMLFNADQLFQSMLLKNGAYNSCIYAFAEAYLIMNPLSDLAQFEEPDPKNLAVEGNYSFEHIVQQIGYKEVYFKALLISLYFDVPDVLQKYYPEFYEVCTGEF